MIPSSKRNLFPEVKSQTTWSWDWASVHCTRYGWQRAPPHSAGDSPPPQCSEPEVITSNKLLISQYFCLIYSLISEKKSNNYYKITLKFTIKRTCLTLSFACEYQDFAFFRSRCNPNSGYLFLKMNSLRVFSHIFLVYVFVVTKPDSIKLKTSRGIKVYSFSIYCSFQYNIFGI